MSRSKICRHNMINQLSKANVFTALPLIPHTAIWQLFQPLGACLVADPPESIRQTLVRIST